jgi:hypothetical protein
MLIPMIHMGFMAGRSTFVVNRLIFLKLIWLQCCASMTLAVKARAFANACGFCSQSYPHPA